MEATTKMVVGVVALVLAFAAVPGYATDHTVGGNSGWTLGFNYGTWASGQTFTVGDKLVFNYVSTHTVDVLPSKSDYDSCNTADPTKTYTSSPTTITLSKPGTTYYVCGTSNHCQLGMKLAVTTVAAASSGGTTPPPSSSSSPTTPSTTPTTPSTPATTTTPPTPSAATSVVGGGGQALLAGTVFLVGLVALLG